MPECTISSQCLVESDTSGAALQELMEPTVSECVAASCDPQTHHFFLRSRVSQYPPPIQSLALIDSLWGLAELRRCYTV